MVRKFTSAAAFEAMERLAALPFFPSAPAAQAMIADEILRMCSSTDQAQWLVRKMCRTFDAWPGPHKMRAVFCSRFAPADGIEAAAPDVFPDGVPTDAEQGLLLPAPERGGGLPPSPGLALPPTHVVSADPDFNAAVIALAKTKSFAAAKPPCPFCSGEGVYNSLGTWVFCVSCRAGEEKRQLDPDLVNERNAARRPRPANLKPLPPLDNPIIDEADLMCRLAQERARAPESNNSTAASGKNRNRLAHAQKPRAGKMTNGEVPFGKQIKRSGKGPQQATGHR